MIIDIINRRSISHTQSYGLNFIMCYKENDNKFSIFCKNTLKTYEVPDLNHMTEEELFMYSTIQPDFLEKKLQIYIEIQKYLKESVSKQVNSRVLINDY